MNEQRKPRIRLFRDVPSGTVFRVVQEKGRTKPGSCGKEPVTPPKGWFVKRRSGVAQSYSSVKEIILGNSDVVDVVAFPKEDVTSPATT
jgi:hypothetical protein